MGRASDLTIRGVFLPWSDWNIEGPPYVDLPLEERAQLVFSTLFGNGPNGVRAVPVLSDGSLAVGFSSAYANSASAIQPPSRTSRIAFVWITTNLAIGASAVWTAAAGTALLAAPLASLTGAQPVVTFPSYDGGTTFPTNSAFSLTSLTAATPVGNSVNANAIRFTNNGAAPATIQLLGVTSLS